MVFYSEPAKSIRAHQGVFDEIVRRLEAAGYSKEMTGQDTRLRSGVHSSWMPSTNRAYPDAWFFQCHNTKTHELKRYAINPNDYVFPDEMPSEVEAKAGASSAKPTGASSSSTDEIVDALLAPLRGMREGRFKLACSAFLKMYHQYRLSFSEIAILWNTLGRDDNIRRMRRQFEKLARRNDERDGVVSRTG